MEPGGHAEEAAADDLDDAEVEAVLEAGAQLFAGRGPNTITIKWVAKEAGLPFERLSARWCSVFELLGDVLDHEARRMSAATPAMPVIHGEPFTEAADALLDRYDRIVVRAILDGIDPTTLQRAFPMIDRLVDELRVDGMDEATARERTFELTMLELGVRLLGPMLATASGLGDRPADQVLELVRTLQRTLADPSSPIPPPAS